MTGAPEGASTTAAASGDPGAVWRALSLADLTTRRLAVLVLFVGLFATAVSIHVDANTFAHLCSGAWMLEHGHVLSVDVFSHTAAGRHWINPTWLSDLGLAWIHRTTGFAGINLAVSLLIWATLLVVFRSERTDTYVRALAVALAAAAMAFVWSARPLIVSLFLVAVFNLVLLRFRREHRNALWLLPPLTAAWANLDGGFAVGLALIGVTFAGTLGTAVVDRMRPVPATRPPIGFRTPLLVGAAGLACMLAAALNPSGFALLPVTLHFHAGGALAAYAQEWRSPDFHQPAQQFFIALWIVTFAMAGLSRRRLDLTDMLLFGAFGTAALLASGFIAYFALVAAPILMRHGGALVSEFEAYALRHGLVRARPRTTQLLNWVLLVLVLAATAAKIQWPLSRGATELSLARSLPVGAVTYFRAHKVQGTLFNASGYGGFLAWSLHPDRLVFVDDRTALYDDAVLEDYARVYMAQPGWDAVLARHGVGAVLVEPNAPIAQALLASPEWRLGYRDWLSVIILRRSS